MFRTKTERREVDPLGSIDPIDPSAHRPAGRMGILSVEELRMLELARRWAPFGGADTTDIYVEFGLSRTQFYDRIQQILERLQKST
ncbi:MULTISPECIES: DUF3263 domain-containing protein [unclassified Rhodococcus (in: high G+C Gram-positive bacteria)]|uniref:DUF3263 domain-containing protein n=1 Tax=unclassified Rhodococcus (in: high G+C Gram-positive bacteria) TaxID=192944 RepID=UPI0015C5B165|nr:MULTISPECIES: DUF3263 domain-containing protein [unclassified Rhodococcus (in: high G+C Gram-positive bacteria)]